MITFYMKPFFYHLKKVKIQKKIKKNSDSKMLLMNLRLFLCVNIGWFATPSFFTHDETKSYFCKYKIHWRILSANLKTVLSKIQSKSFHTKHISAVSATFKTLWNLLKKSLTKVCYNSLLYFLLSNANILFWSLKLKRNLWINGKQWKPLDVIILNFHHHSVSVSKLNQIEKVSNNYQYHI